jgi:TolA-binding protein
MPNARPPLPRTLAVVLVAVLPAIGCQSMTKFKDGAYKSMRSMVTSSYHDAEAEAKMAKAEELFAAGDHKAAQAIFADLADNTYNPTMLAEKARFYEGECLRERKKLPDAAASYNRMLQDFPAGAYRQQACDRMYEIAYGWLESDTLADIEAEQAGKAPPWWQRAAKAPNVFDNTRPLFDTEGEALRVLDNVQTHDLIGPNADKALFWLGYVNFYRGRFEEADQYFSSLVETHKDSKLRPTALRLAIMAKNNSTGGSAYDSAKASEALQLVHHAEATEPAYTRDEKESAWLTRQKMAILMQLADKEFEQAQYYERTGHLPSAYFKYQLVCRQYPGTKYSDLAKMRLAELDKVRQQIEADRAAGKYDGTLGTLRRQWDRMTGAPTDDAPRETDIDTTRSAPAASPKPPVALPADITHPR